MEPYIIRQSPAWFNYGLLHVTKESRYSSLMPWHIQDVSAALLKEVKNIKHIIDCTGHIGCDSILFRSLFPSLNISIFENDKDTFNILKQNIDKLPLITSNPYVKPIFVYNNDCLDYIYKYDLTDTAVYFDPPWGGVDYKIDKNVDLYLSGINIINIISFINAPLIILKLPINFNFSSLSIFKNITTYPIHTNTKLSYYLCFIKK